MFTLRKERYINFHSGTLPPPAAIEMLLPISTHSYAFPWNENVCPSILIALNLFINADPVVKMNN